MSNSITLRSAAGRVEITAAKNRGGNGYRITTDDGSVVLKVGHFRKADVITFARALLADEGETLPTAAPQKPSELEELGRQVLALAVAHGSTSVHVNTAVADFMRGKLGVTAPFISEEDF